MVATEYTYPETVNLEVLDTELLTAFSSAYIGAKSGVNGNGVIVIIDDSITQQQVQTIITAHDPNILTEEQESTSFLVAMRPIVSAWHKGTANISTTLTNIGTVLDAHTAHKAVINGVVWAAKRLTINPVGNVTLGNIVGNSVAEQAYREAVFAYWAQVYAGRNITTS